MFLSTKQKKIRINLHFWEKEFVAIIISRNVQTGRNFKELFLERQIFIRNYKDVRKIKAHYKKKCKSLVLNITNKILWNFWPIKS